MKYTVKEAVYYLEGLWQTGIGISLFLTKWEVLQVGKKYVTIGASGNKATSSNTTRFVPSNNEDYDRIDSTVNQISHYYQSGYRKKGCVDFGDGGASTAVIFKSRDIAEEFIQNQFNMLQYTYTDAYKPN